MKRIIGIMLVTFMLIGTLASCAPKVTTSPSSSSATATPTVAPKVTLKYWAYARWTGITGKEATPGEFGDWQRDVAKKFTAANPNVTIEFEHLPWNGGPEKVNVAISTGTQPDVLEDGTGRIFSYIPKDAVQSLDDKLTAAEIADMTPGSWDLVKYSDGKHYAIPWGNMVLNLLINLDIFKKYNALDLLPTNDEKTWTYDQFKAALKAVSKDGIYGTALYAGNEQGDSGTNALMWGFGAQIFSDDRKKIVYNSPEGIKGAEFLYSLVQEKLVMPGAETIKATDTTDYFTQGKIAIVLNGSSGFISGTLQPAFDQGKAKKFEVGWAMSPTASGVAPRFYANVVVVSALKSGNADQENYAVALAKFATMGENAKAIQTVSLIPTFKSAGELYAGNALMEWDAKVIKYAYDPGLSSPVYAQMRACLFPEMQAMYTGVKTPTQALNDFAAKAQAEIDKIK